MIKELGEEQLGQYWFVVVNMTGEKKMKTGINNLLSGMFEKDDLYPIGAHMFLLVLYANLYFREWLVIIRKQTALAWVVALCAVQIKQLVLISLHLL